MENKRRHKRVPLNCMLDIFDFESRKILGQVLDITVEGMQIMSLEPISKDRNLTVKMKLPEIILGHNSLVLLVKKVWGVEEMNIFYTGFHIEKISLEETAVIRELINKYGNNQ